MEKNKNSSRTNKKPWPTKAAMAQVYEMNLWGGDKSDFYSGTGSHQRELILPYLEVVTDFLKSFDNPPTVCDLGCGDFNVGKELVEYTERYIAVDIVDELIERNIQLFSDDNLEFHCLDIAVDDLPFADCALVRQVLQHLSNAEVINILRRLSDYKYIILTEHVPNTDFIPNVDIISGQGTRLKKGSGVDVTAPPFNFEVVEKKELLSISEQENKGIIVTTLFKMF